MSPADAGKLLALCAAFDNRKPDTSGMAAAAWADALGGLDFNECAAAIRRHFRESSEYVMPIHVRDGVLRAREERRKAALERKHWKELQPAPEECVPMPRYVKEAWREFLAARQLPEEAS